MTKYFLVRVNFSVRYAYVPIHTYHSVEITEILSSQCGNLQIFPPPFFCKNFAKSNVSLKLYNELYCKSIWRKIFAVGENFWNFHTVLQCELREFRIFFCHSDYMYVLDIWGVIELLKVTQCGNFRNFPPLRNFFVKLIYSITL